MVAGSKNGSWLLLKTAKLCIQVRKNNHLGYLLVDLKNPKENL